MTRRAALVTATRQWDGGVESVNYLLTRLLEEQGFTVSLHTADSPGARRWPFGRLPHRRVGLLARETLKECDLRICSGEYAWGAPKPCIVVFHGSYLGYEKAVGSFRTWRSRLGLRRLAREQAVAARGNRVVAVSQWLAGVLSAQGIAVDQVIKNPVDTDHFRPIGGASPKGCLFVGTIDYWGKGIDRLERLAARGIAVDSASSQPPPGCLGWLGRIAAEDLPDVYSSHALLLLLSRFEGSSMVLLEAMACGVPVLTTAVGSGLELAQAIPEFVLSPAEAEDTDAAMRRIELISARRDEFGRMAREYVTREHGLAKWNSEWRRLLERLAPSGRPVS